MIFPRIQETGKELFPWPQENYLGIPGPGTWTQIFSNRAASR